MDQITAIMDISDSCEQEIINNCTGNMLSDLSWWTDRTGNEFEYWHGRHYGFAKGCKCSLDGSGCDENNLGEAVS